MYSHHTILGCSQHSCRLRLRKMDCFAKPGDDARIAQLSLVKGQHIIIHAGSKGNKRNLRRVKHAKMRQGSI